MILFLAALAFGASSRAAQITIYSDNQALVKERRTFDLPAGVVYTSSYPVPIGFEPNSVQIRALNGAADVEVLEENFDPGLSNKEEILKNFIGQKIRVEETNTASSLLHILRGVLIESRQNLNVVESEGRIYLNPPGTFVLKSPPDDLRLKPTLKWKLKVFHAGQHQFETDYLTSGLSWEADYAAVVNAPSNRMDLSVWASVHNRSGRDFPQSKIKLVAGSPNQASAAPPRPRPLFRALAAAPNIIAKGRAFFEYHVYNIPGTVNLNERTRRISFGQAKDIPVQKVYIYDASDILGDFNQYTRSNPDYGSQSQGEVQVIFKLQNVKSSHLGLALPPGMIQFYQRDKDGSLEWIGGDSFAPLAKGEKAEIHVGRAFDVLGRRKRVLFETESKKTKEGFEITLTNRKDSDISVEVIEHLYRWSKWKIVSSDRKWKKKDAQTIIFEIPVKKNSSSKINYVVEYSWR